MKDVINAEVVSWVKWRKWKLYQCWWRWAVSLRFKQRKWQHYQSGIMATKEPRIWCQLSNHIVSLSGITRYIFLQGIESLLHWRSFKRLSTWLHSGTWRIQIALGYLHLYICIEKRKKTQPTHHPTRQPCESQAEKSQLHKTLYLLLLHLGW